MTWTLLPEKVDLSLEAPTPLPFLLKPEKTALVVCNMQKRILKDPGSREYAVIEGNMRLLAKARAAGVKVFFTQNVRLPDSYEFTVFGREPYLLAESPEAEILDELAPLPGEQVIKTYTNDPFARTELAQAFEESALYPTDVTVLVTGVSALVSVYTACVGFKNRNYLPLIPMDCVAGETIEQEARAYNKYTGGYGSIGNATTRYAFTLSTMLEFSPAGMTTRDIVEVLAARRPEDAGPPY